LSEAISIADEFLDDKKLIVYTEGRKSPKEEFKAEKEGMFEHGRLVVLVDESSASASEILSGAIQDWDRGVIMGRRTFGKGLVQEQFSLNNGGALRLTIARYYTPSGRCIQRSYAKGKDDYEEDFDHRLASGELTGNDTLAQGDSAKYFTHNHRLVYGGGGIKPDVYVPYDTLLFNNALLRLINGDAFRDALWNYFLSHKQQLKTYKDIHSFSEHFDAAACLQTIINTAPNDSLKPLGRLLTNPESKRQIALQISSNMARYLFRNEGYFSLFTRGDDMVKRAQQLLSSPHYEELVGGKF
jgi:carboxyl-terminal processing protease